MYTLNEKEFFRILTQNFLLLFSEIEQPCSILSLLWTFSVRFQKLKLRKFIISQNFFNIGWPDLSYDSSIFSFWITYHLKWLYIISHLTSNPLLHRKKSSNPNVWEIRISGSGNWCISQSNPKLGIVQLVRRLWIPISQGSKLDPV